MLGLFVYTTMELNSEAYTVRTASRASSEEILTGNNTLSKLTSPSQLPSGTLIDICTADEDVLCMLPGIGPSLAAAIVEYRSSTGGFDSIEDIMLVPGIGEARFSAIADYICVNSTGD